MVAVRMLIKRICGLGFLGFLLVAGQISAHDRSESFSKWSWKGEQIHYSFSVLQREVTRIPLAVEGKNPLVSYLEDYLGKNLSVRQHFKDGSQRTCSVDLPAKALPSRLGYLKVEGSFRCKGAGAISLSVNTFFDLIGTHTHYARVRTQLSDGAQVSELLFTRSFRNQEISVDHNTVTRWQAFTEYLWVGAEHIAGGIDHLAFLFGLLLLAFGCKDIAWLITGFTLGHSISLMLATLDIVTPNGTMVEAMIGFTILLVIVEAEVGRCGNLWHLSPWMLIAMLPMSLIVWLSTDHWLLVVGVLGFGLFSLCYLRLVSSVARHTPLHIIITMIFGLIHGFGFAGGLLEAKFPAEQLAFVLLGFNLGVELGQLIVVIIVALLIYTCRRAFNTRQLLTVRHAIVTLLSGLGTFWFVSRLLG